MRSAKLSNREWGKKEERTVIQVDVAGSPRTYMIDGHRPLPIDPVGETPMTAASLSPPAARLRLQKNGWGREEARERKRALSFASRKREGSYLSSSLASIGSLCLARYPPWRCRGSKWNHRSIPDRPRISITWSHQRDGRWVMWQVGINQSASMVSRFIFFFSENVYISIKIK